MKLRKYDYFKVSDDVLKLTFDRKNLYQALDFYIDGRVKAINVENRTQKVFTETEMETATRLNQFEMAYLLIHDECKYKKSAITSTETVKERATTEPTKIDDTDVDMINKPPHYTHGMECIDEMILIFGAEKVKSFCLCNAWKYRKRALYKNGEQDMAKSDWYINKLKELEIKK